MKRTLYDSRAIPLDVLFKMTDSPRGRFGDPDVPVCETTDAPKVKPNAEDDDDARYQHHQGA